MAVHRVGVLCSGGDAPGLNAVIRAAVKVGRNELGLEIVGICDGFSGLLDGPRIRTLDVDDVAGMLPRGGTFLGTTSRGNPLHWDVGPLAGADRSEELAANIRSLGLDALLVIGGDGSLRISLGLIEKGVPIVGIPKTIDNDIDLTDVTFGFDTAVTTAMEAIDRLHTTADSHHRVMVLELMGRHVGWIALKSGIAGGADVILIPEIPYSVHAVAAKVLERVSAGRLFTIVVVAEGALPVGGAETYVDSLTGRLGGIGAKVAHDLEQLTERQTRVTVLGHIQRGGSPTCFDRLLATRFGAAGIRLAAAECFGQMAALHGDAIVSVPIADAVAHLKLVPSDGELVRTARGLGICMGD